jgi:hypothetical protein
MLQQMGLLMLLAATISAAASSQAEMRTQGNSTNVKIEINFDMPTKTQSLQAVISQLSSSVFQTVVADGHQACHNNEVASNSLMAGVVSALGFTCTSFNGAYGTSQAVPGMKLDNGQCFVSAMDRALGTFDCDFSANSGKKRLCWCTLAADAPTDTTTDTPTDTPIDAPTNASTDPLCWRRMPTGCDKEISVCGCTGTVY